MRDEKNLSFHPVTLSSGPGSGFSEGMRDEG